MENNTFLVNGIIPGIAEFKIVQVYAPITTYSEEDINRFVIDEDEP